ncbi:complement factor H-related protein 1-like isoform X2 [Mixophyes fleayi]|uniref:complement factor H-related protein 1-like isoform X2 n=1 Tax=Mixophyes fleayi TaxID=3061075 RepID=UPI003F4E276B
MHVLELIYGILPFSVFCNAAPTDQKAICAKPSQMQNAELLGDWRDETYPSGSIASYSCRPGYINSFKKVCLEGKWEILKNKQCKKRSCGNPGDILFGTFELRYEDEFVFGAVVEYSCEEGYQMMSKQKTRVCSATGWTNQPPHCEGHVIRLECKNSKDKLTGPSEIFCTTNGTWNMVPPTCKGQNKISSTLTVVVNTDQELCIINDNQLKGNNTRLIKKYENRKYAKHGEILEFECLPEYEMSDPKLLRRICTSGVLLYPKCVKMKSKPCGQPPIILHGEFTGIIPITDAYNSGSFVKYQCPQLFKLEGHQRIKCQNGVWEDPPVCLEPCTTKEIDMKEYHILLRWKGNNKLCTRHELKKKRSKMCYTKHGEEVEFTCLSGYEIPDPKSLKIKCSNGVLQYPKCFKTARN